MKAAIIAEGKTFTGRSHADAIMSAPPITDFDNRKEGFLTDEGEFLNRRDAYDYAKERGLIDERAKFGSLQSWMLK